MDHLPVKGGPLGYVVIHGHFYQPPRENPWIEQIEVESGAQPFHDWNARINAECYSPNAAARVYDGQRRIMDIINNYEHISFNFGPTLISWLAENAPETYARILEADRQSVMALGHGNALAQAYNHAILPLCRERDRETQIIWGLKDFERRCQRPAAAMWLPETAVDFPTLAALVDHGMKFVILSPYQARRVRPLAGGEWTPAAGPTLDSTQAYRCFLPGATAAAGKRRHIDVFFYNGEVAADLSFGDLLTDSYRLASRLVEGYSPGRSGRPQILNVATDGENYGHHKKFGDLALAHALSQVLPQKGFHLTNYTAFLELAPPVKEVELYLGPRGEGSSWSCPHGVGRWKEDCGCATGSQPGWNQRWRAPVREAFNWLNDRLAGIFEGEGQKYLRDPWAARNAYHQVLLDRSPGVLEDFFSRQGVPGLKEADWVPALKLLEMQRHALLMFTSCGWFFAELSGLETLQVLKYATRALQLGQAFSREHLEQPFLRLLEKAKSNIPKEGNGRTIYFQRIKPVVVDYPKVANQWVISWLQERQRQARQDRVYHYRVEPLDQEDQTQGGLLFAAGRLRLTSGVTLETEELAYFTAFLGSYLYRTQVQSSPDHQEYQGLKVEFFQVLEKTPEDLIPLMVRRLGESYYSFQDLFREEKVRMFQDLMRDNQEEAVSLISHHFESAGALLKAMAAEKLPLPRLYRALGEITLNRRLVELLRQVEPQPSLLATSQDILDLVKETEFLGLKLESGEGAQILQRLLQRHLDDLAAGFRGENATHLRHFLSLVSRIPITLDLTGAQNSLFHLMKEHFPEVAAKAAKSPEADVLARELVKLMEDLSFSPVRYLKLLG
ncbi:MAG: DUF3536 domain-containing protein [Desulfobaccales bacterium]